MPWVEESSESSRTSVSVCDYDCWSTVAWSHSHLIASHRVCITVAVATENLRYPRSLNSIDASSFFIEIRRVYRHKNSEPFKEEVAIDPLLSCTKNSTASHIVTAAKNWYYYSLGSAHTLRSARLKRFLQLIASFSDDVVSEHWPCFPVYSCFHIRYSLALIFYAPADPWKKFHKRCCGPLA